MERRRIIYGLTDPKTGEVRYIGKSSSGMRRPRDHFTESSLKQHARTHKAKWIRKVHASGNACGIVVLEECMDESALNSAEIRWIAHGRAQGWQLTNATDGGEGVTGLRMSEETKAKLSAANKGRKLTDAHRAKMSAAMKDRYFSPEHRARISAAQKGRKLSPERIDQLRQANMGRKNTPEAIAKTAAANRGRKMSDQTKEVLRLANTGRRHPPEIIERIAAQLRGRKLPPRSPEWRARLSASLKGRKMSAESIEQGASKKRGRKLSPEHRKALRDAKARQREAGTLGVPPERRLKIAAAARRQWERQADPILNVTTGAIYPTQLAAAAAIGVTGGMIGHVLNGRAKAVKGQVLRKLQRDANGQPLI